MVAGIIWCWDQLVAKICWVARFTWQLGSVGAGISWLVGPVGRQNLLVGRSGKKELVGKDSWC